MLITNGWVTEVVVVEVVIVDEETIAEVCDDDDEVEELSLAFDLLLDFDFVKTDLWELFFLDDFFDVDEDDVGVFKATVSEETVVVAGVDEAVLETGCPEFKTCNVTGSTSTFTSCPLCCIIRRIGPLLLTEPPPLLVPVVLN